MGPDSGNLPHQYMGSSVVLLFPILSVIPNTKYMRPKTATCWSSLTHLGASAEIASQWSLSSGLLRTQLSQEPRTTRLLLSLRSLGSAWKV